jgi:predicted kinase
LSLNLILVRGVSGAGKTTLAEMLAQLPNTNEVSADEYWGPDYAFDHTKLHLAHHWCQLTARAYLQDGCSVVVHNTSTTERDVKVYQAIAKEYGANFTALIVENRHGNDSVHSVPQHVRKDQEMKLRNSIKLI